MKTLYFIFLFSIPHSDLIFDDSSPTLKETVDFIISKTTGFDSAYWKNHIPMHETNISYEFNYATKTLIQFNKGTSGYDRVKHNKTFYIPFKYLNASMIQIYEKAIEDDGIAEPRHDLFIILNTSDGSKKITYIDEYGTEEKKTYYTNSVYICIPSDIQKSNIDIANRLVKAFAHAIKLCGGKVEKF